MSERHFEGSNGFARPLPQIVVEPETVAWRARLVSWIDEQRSDVRQIPDLVYHCIACGADTPISDLVARRRAS